MKKMVSFELGEGVADQLGLLTMFSGKTKKNYLNCLVAEKFAEWFPSIQMWAELSGQDLVIPEPAPEYMGRPKSPEVLATEAELQARLDLFRRAEEQLEAKAKSTVEGDAEFLAALRRGEIAVVDGKIRSVGLGMSTRAFSGVDIVAGMWIHDISSNKYLKSLNIPKEIKIKHGIRDKTYGLFSMRAEGSGEILADRRRLRISSGCEILIPTELQQVLAGVDRVQVTYHGAM